MQQDDPGSKLSAGVQARRHEVMCEGLQAALHDIVHIPAHLMPVLCATNGVTDVVPWLQGICDMAGAKLGKLQNSLLSAARAQAGMLHDMRTQVSQQNHSGVANNLACNLLMLACSLFGQYCAVAL